VTVVRLVVIVGSMLAACGDASARGPDASAVSVGAARVEWQVVDRAGDPCSCKEAGAGIVRVIARAPSTFYEDGFECVQELAVTAPLAAGDYDIELQLETDDGVVLAGARTRGAIGGGLVDLGTVELAVGG
jgi:hypothetical protein